MNALDDFSDVFKVNTSGKIVDIASTIMPALAVHRMASSADHLPRFCGSRHQSASSRDRKASCSNPQPPTNTNSTMPIAVA